MVTFSAELFLSMIYTDRLREPASRDKPSNNSCWFPDTNIFPVGWFYSKYLLWTAALSLQFAIACNSRNRFRFRHSNNRYSCLDFRYVEFSGMPRLLRYSAQEKALQSSVGFVLWLIYVSFRDFSNPDIPILQYLHNKIQKFLVQGIEKVIKWNIFIF